MTVRADRSPMPPGFWYLWTGILVNQLGSFVILFLAVYLTQVRGFSAAAAGIVVSLAYGGGGLVGTFTGGVLADLLGRRVTILVAHLCTAAATLAMGFAAHPVALIGCALVAGTAGNAARPAASAMIVDLTAGPQRERAFALQFWAVNAGFACAAIVGGLLVDTDYRALFVIDAATTAVTAAIVFTKVRETHPPDARTTGAESRAGFARIARDGPFLALVGLTVLFGVVFMQHISTLPLALRADGFGSSVYGGLIALNAGLIIVLQLWVPKAVAGRDPARVLALAAVFMGCGFALLALAHELWGYALSTVIWTAGEMLQASLVPSLVAALSPPAARGRYQGLFAQAFPVAALIGPALGGVLLQHAGAGVLWTGCLVLGLLCAVGHLAAGPARLHRLAESATATTATR
ncbi:MAG: MFS transporter [Umezawaea sp.]